jgi:hypothetical protein
MYHTLQFAVAITADLEISRKQPLERVRIQKGTRLRAQLRPYVTESDYGPVEVADLFFENGTATRGVPYECFSFVEEAA